MRKEPEPRLGETVVLSYSFTGRSDRWCLSTEMTGERSHLKHSNPSGVTKLGSMYVWSV